MSLDFQQWKKSPLTRVSSGEPQTLSTLESIPSPPLHPETGGGYCLQNLYYFICPQGSLITQISSPQIFHFKCLIQNNYHHQHHHAPPTTSPPPWWWKRPSQYTLLSFRLGCAMGKANGVGLPCSSAIQVGPVALRPLTDQPAKHSSRLHSSSFCLYPVFLSFPLILPPSAWIPDPFISIHYRDSFMHGRETPPSSRVWRQTEGEGHEGGESQRERE